MEEKNKGGRPTLYTTELAAEICDAVACSQKGLKRLCEENPHWPDKSTIIRWRFQNTEFYDQYARAKDFQVECAGDELLEIADDGSNDYMLNKDGNEVIDHEHVRRSILRVDTRKWLLSKLLPKKYGDRVQTEISGKNGAPIEYAELTDDERKQRVLELLDTARERRTAASGGD